ncbi:MAG: DUF423 domain-containing protein [Myxococcales bacterium]|nr:DUF423 domain-containing protein [Myxococcales bacterium]MCB9546739.1 DUF423 domain-containing protein [Myxococcales bacterium]
MNGAPWAMAGAIATALAVGFGAFGAHGLKGRVGPDALAWWHTGAQYHLHHALGLFAVAWISTWSPHPRLVTTAGVALVAGLLLFSGSLYAMALTGMRGLGAITPLGGTAWIVGWICLALACRR